MKIELNIDTTPLHTKLSFQFITKATIKMGRERIPHIFPRNNTCPMYDNLENECQWFKENCIFFLKFS